jgi:DNA-binding transcriptional LysR family regulator
MEYAARILAVSGELEIAMKDLAGNQLSGPLHIGASTTIADYFLPIVLGRFKAKYPAVRPLLTVANSEEVQAQVADRNFDIGFIEGETYVPSLLGQACGEDELLVVCAPSHPLAKQASVTPRSLTKHPFIRREPGSGTREVVDSYLRKADVALDSLNVAMEIGSPEATKGLVATGQGFAIMSRATITKEVRLGYLTGIPLSPRLKRNLIAIYPKERLQARLGTTFLKFVQDRLSSSR